MSADDRKPVTRVLHATAHGLESVGCGDPRAAQDRLPLVYDELRTLARARLKKVPPGQTLQPTALVHEAYLRVVGSEDPGWDGRGHFFAAAAQAMRDILVEHAHRKTTKKRGGDRRRVPTEQAKPTFEPPSEAVLAVDEAVKRLERDDPRKGQIVNLRFFARLTAGVPARRIVQHVARSNVHCGIFWALRCSSCSRPPQKDARPFLAMDPRMNTNRPRHGCQG